MTSRPAAAALAVLLSGPATGSAADRYANFEAAIYARAYEVREMGDLERLRARFEVMEKHVKVSKMYLETHRDKILVDSETLEKAKGFFEARGIRTAGGITLTIDERNRFETFCYSDPDDRSWVQQVVEHTARHFDEIILDDFFFTSCKSEVEIRARGERSWTEYRLALLDEAARNLVLAPARKVNPRVKVVIKYPNWYDHFHGLGFNLETQPQIFDAIYTGTETRDAVRSAQHLQPYHGYQIWRYLENLRPGHNAGGWVDTGGMRTLDRYAEQLWVTLFAKAPEITLFDFRQMQIPVHKGHRASWQGQGTSLDFDEVVGPYRRDDGSFAPELTVSRVAGWSLQKIDPILGQLGKPVGVKSYKPYHSTGEDFLHSFIGMVGIPIDLRPEFPTEAPLVLLTGAAAHDPGIVGKIERQLRAGKNVLITSGLLRALQGKGIERIAELEVLEQRALVDEFRTGFGDPVKGRKKILIPQLRYFTNDSWSLIDAVDGPMGWPLLHDADYAGGHLYVWTIPDNPADLYALPDGALNQIRRTATQGLDVRIDGPAEVSLFLYDNGTLVVESFRDEATEVSVVVKGAQALRDLETGTVLPGQGVPEGQGFFRSPDAGRTVIEVPMKPHSFRAFKTERAAPPSDGAGAFATGKHRNLFVEAGHTEAETDAKIARAWKQLFEGDPQTERLFTPSGRNENGPLAYIPDIQHTDVRSEGMSYGMMIAVQLDRKAEFDALWNWSMTYMYQKDPKHPSYGFFSWQVAYDGSVMDELPAPDGEEYYAMALYFAAHRWGNGKGLYDYAAHADRLLRDMVHRQPITGMVRQRGGLRQHTVGKEVNDEHGMILFSPDERNGMTDASYHLPAFYELWARWGPEEDRAFWARAAAVSRDYLVKAAHPKTGLVPNLGGFDATPWGFRGPESAAFREDAWRVAMNWSVDWSWWEKDPRQRELSDRLQGFFERQGLETYGDNWKLDGTLIRDRHSPGLVATNGVASLAATDGARARRFTEALWNLDVPSSSVFRYYDGLLYLMSLMHAGGRFQVIGPNH